MIIDAHTHLGRNEHINASVSQLLQSMDEAKVDKALVFAGELNDCPNEYLLKEVAPYRDRLLPVLAFDPKKNYVEQRLDDYYREGKIVAVKFYTGYDHYYPHQVYPLLALLNEVGCPAIFHSGDCLNSVKKAKLKYAHPLHIDEVAVDYTNINFIVAHMGYPWVRDAAEVCYKNENVYSDISGFVYKEFEPGDRFKFQKNLQEFLEIAGSDKLLFGTDWPIANQHSYLETLHWLADHTACSEVRSVFNPKYLSQNVVRAFKLKV